MKEQQPVPQYIAESISKRVESGRIVERNFDVLRTNIPDFFILVDHNVHPDLSLSQIARLAVLNQAYGIRAEIIRALEELQKEPHDELESFGVNVPGVRGARDRLTGFETQINPNTKDYYDEVLLDESLGDKRPEFVHKTVTVTVKLDPDKDDVDGFITSLKRRLKRQGFTKEEAEKMVGVKRTLRVDKNELQKRIENGEVQQLIPGAWEIKTVDWDIVPRRIPTTKELEEEEEKLRQNLTS